MRTSESESWLNGLCTSLEKSSVCEYVVGGRPLDAYVEKDPGGPGSGHFGHSGRGGKVGGSLPGGVLVGREDVPASRKQFKFSGESTHDRAGKAPMQLRVSGRAIGRPVMIEGVKDSRGHLVKGRYRLIVRGRSVEVDAHELHTLRSKMRWLHDLNTRVDPRTGAEWRHAAKRKGFATGNSLNVTAGDESIDIGVDQESVNAFNAAVGDARKSGYHLTGESPARVRAAVEEAIRSGKSLDDVLRREQFSKAGHLAANIAFMERYSPSDLRRLKEKKGVLPSMMGRFVDAVHFNMAKGHARGRRRLMEKSGTQAAYWYRRATISAQTLENL